MNLESLLVALVAGCGLALMTGPLGCFVVWRRMAYFGDTLAHIALFGVAISLLTGIPLGLTVPLVCVIGAMILLVLKHRVRTVSLDAWFGLTAHFFLALGLIVLTFSESPSLDLEHILYGDIIAVRLVDVAWIWATALFLLFVLSRIWNRLLAITLDSALAQAEGIRVFAVEAVFMVLIAIAIGLAMQFVGILLCTSLLIIPAIAARGVSKSPEQMAVIAALIGGLSVAGGLLGVFLWGIPAGPSIVVMSVLLLCALSAMKTILSGK